MIKISKNAADKFNEKLCVCYRNDQESALLTPKKDVDQYQGDMDTYVRSQATGFVVEDTEKTLGTLVATSKACEKYTSKFVMMQKILTDVFVKENNETRDAEGGPLSWFQNNVPPAYRVIMTDKDWGCVQNNSCVDLGLQDQIDVIKNLETRNKK